MFIPITFEKDGNVCVRQLGPAVRQSAVEQMNLWLNLLQLGGVFLCFFFFFFFSVVLLTLGCGLILHN